MLKICEKEKLSPKAKWSYKMFCFVWLSVENCSIKFPVYVQRFVADSDSSAKLDVLLA